MVKLACFTGVWSFFVANTKNPSIITFVSELFGLYYEKQYIVDGFWIMDGFWMLGGVGCAR